MQVDGSLAYLEARLEVKTEQRFKKANRNSEFCTQYKNSEFGKFIFLIIFSEAHKRY